MTRRLLAAAGVAAVALISVPAAGSASAQPCKLNECWVYTLACQTVPCPPFIGCPYVLPDLRVCV